MAIVPLFGSGTKGKSANVTSQRRINLYAERSDDKAQTVYYSRPGLSPALFTQTTGATDGSPVRGMIAVNRVVNPGLATQQTIDVVIGAQGAYSFATVNNPTRTLPSYPTVTLQTASGPVVFADDGLSVIGVDGTSAYVAVYSVGSYSLTDMETIPVSTFPYGARTICSIAGRFVVENPTYPGRFYWSGLQDYSAWDALDYATAETVPDVLSGVYSFRGELLLFGTKSIEFWAPTGDTSVFARVGGAAAPWGLVSYGTIQPVEDTLFFVGRRGGEIEVCALSGYNAQAVSTPDVEYDINNNAGGPMSALTLRSGGHTFYVLNLSGKTWAYDVNSGQWDEWQTDGGRFSGQYTVVAYGFAIVSDYRGYSFWGVDPDAYTDCDEAMTREITSRHVFADLDRIGVAKLQLDMETGVGLEEGQGSDPQIMLQVSKDGGHTFGNELWASLGALGQYAKQVVWRRIGMARDMVFRFRVTDPVKVVFINAGLQIDKGE